MPTTPLTPETALAAAKHAAHPLASLNVKIFADGADRVGILSLYADPLVAGLTTNPTLMRKAGISDYEVLLGTYSTSLSASRYLWKFSLTTLAEMRRQALKIATGGTMFYVRADHKHAGVNRQSRSFELSHEGVKINVTALLTTKQVREVAEALADSVPAVVFCVCERIADTGGI